MLDIEWRSGFGYGDFVTGLGYAHVASIKYQTPTNITFHWNHSKRYKESKQDPETIIDRMHYVYDTMQKLDNVEISFKCNSSLPYRFINNLDEHEPLHGLWYSNLEIQESNVVVLWRSKFNTYFPGTEKDPAHNEWDDIIEYLEDSNYTVKEVTYRTPIRDVIEYMRICKFGIGYDGMVHQLFKYMWKPLVVICKRPKLNNLLVPQAAVESDINKFYLNGIDSYVKQSQVRCIQYKDKLDRWLSNYRDAKTHPLYNKPNG